MPRLTRHTMSSHTRDRGAVGVIVAVLLASGLVFALAAMVIDTGQAYVTRAKLQNGADAAALAVAGGCARGSAYCDAGTGSGSVAGKHAISNINVAHDTVTVSTVCGHDPFGILPVCPAPPTTPLSCGSAPPAGTNYAEVRTQSLLPPVFGNAALGSGDTGVTVHACARARWGSPNNATGMALTISYCEWLSYIGGNASSPVYAPPPPAIPPASAEIVVYFHDTNPSPTHCIAGPSGADVPGDFGSTVTTSGCVTTFNFNAASGTTTYTSNPGSSLTSDCAAAVTAAAASHRVVYVPIYDQVTGTGGNGTYRLWTMAAFVVTGYYWPSWSANSWLTHKQPCKGNGRCISGYFTTGVVPGTDVGNGTGAGAAVVMLTN